jgi:hypothetical protein
MLKLILISTLTILTLFATSLGFTEQINYTLPFKAQYYNLTPDTKEQIECLAENIYFESAYEPTEGKMAVAFVTLNRMKSGLFADTICDVVKQKIRNVCQFSWWCEEKPYAISTSKSLTNNPTVVYNRIRDIAIHVYLNHDRMTDPSNGALFYHADYVDPKWKNMIRTTVIGHHIFYNRKNLIKGELV